VRKFFTRSTAESLASSSNFIAAVIPSFHHVSKWSLQ
jgi:hypothetical protein